jgi:predicted nuclease of predicted toxin-antitoxin system
VKALLDEQLSPRIAELLRDRGHDVQAVVERRDLAGWSDRLILEVAAAEERAVITNNVKDFRPLAAERLARGEFHAGLILLPSTRTRTRGAVETLTNAIEEILRKHPDDLAATERWIPPMLSS